MILSSGLAVGLEGDEGDRPGFGDCVDVLAAEVSLVRRDFLHREILSGRTQQGRKKGSIMPLAVRDLGGGNDVGLGAAHQVSLEPFTPGAFLAPFVLHPTVESGSAKPRSVHGETPFNRGEWKARLRDESLKDFCQIGLTKNIEDAVEVGNLPDEAPVMGFPQIAHEAATGDGAVDLERSRKKGIGHRDRLASRFVPGWLGNAVDEVFEQDLELIFLVDLGVVVGPLDRLGDADALLNGPVTVFVDQLFNRYLNGHDVFADDSASVEVGTGATGSSVEANGVRAIFALKRDDPLPFLLLNFESGCDLNRFDLSGIHGFFSLPCKGHGPHNAGNSLHGCLWHLAGLGPVGCCQHSAEPIYDWAGAVGIEPTSSELAARLSFQIEIPPRLSTKPPLKYGFLFGVLVADFPVLPYQLDLLFFLESAERRVEDRQWLLVAINVESYLTKVIPDFSRAHRSILADKYFANGVRQSLGLIGYRSISKIEIGTKAHRFETLNLPLESRKLIFQVASLCSFSFKLTADTFSVFPAFFHVVLIHKDIFT